MAIDDANQDKNSTNKEDTLASSSASAGDPNAASSKPKIGGEPVVIKEGKATVLAAASASKGEVVAKNKGATQHHNKQQDLNRIGKLKVFEDGAGDENNSPPIPIQQQELVLERSKTITGGKLEVIRDGEDHNAPIPIQQLTASAKNSCKLEVIGDGIIIDPIPVEQLVVALEDEEQGGPYSSSLLPTSGRQIGVGGGGGRSKLIIDRPVLPNTRPSGDDTMDQLEVDVDALSNLSPLPIFEATLCEEDNVYDAVVIKDGAVCPFKYVLGGVVSVITVVILAVTVAFARNAAVQDQKKKEGFQSDLDTPRNNVTAWQGACFTNRTELKLAIDQYAEQDCSNDDGCVVGQRYGWPMNFWCVSKIKDMHKLFIGRAIFNEDISDWDVSSVSDMSGMFYAATLFNGNLSSWDVSSVTDMSQMFYGAMAFDCDLQSWEVSSVTDISEMFYGATAFTSDLSSWDVSSVTDMKWIFYKAYSFNGNLSSWDVSSVTDMSGMFFEATNFNSDLSNWDVSSVTDMSSMFSATIFNGDLSSWDVSSVTDMTEMFDSAASYNGNLSTWNDSSVTTMNRMFFRASLFRGDVSSWDVSSVTDMNRMFEGATAIKSDLSKWDVSSVTDLGSMFVGAFAFNSDLSSWNVSSVTNIDSMFQQVATFNCDLSQWDVGSVSSMDNTFNGAAAFNGNLSRWDVSMVTSMSNMFRGASSFNNDISSWNVSSVTNMNCMFYDAATFNTDLSNWDVSSVTDVTAMFQGATSFNQDLCYWADEFSYTAASNIFAKSGCTFQSQPKLDQQGPFCASSTCPKIVRDFG